MTSAGSGRGAARAGRWNLLRGMAFSVLTAGPPLAAARFIPPDDYLAWIVAYSFIPWLMASQIGLQPGVLAIVGAVDQAPGGLYSRGAVGRTAMALSGVLYVAAVCLLWLAAVAAGAAGVLPSAIADALARPAVTLLLMLVGLGQAQASVANAYMLAAGRAKTMATLTVGSAVTLAGFVLWSHATTPTIPANGLSAALIVAFLFPVVGTYLVLRGDGPVVRSTVASSFPVVARRLVRFIGAQAVWVVPGIFVSGLDNILVAQFDAPALRPYSVGVGISAAAMGALGALASPYVPVLSRLWSKRPLGDPLVWADILAPLIRLSRTAVVLATIFLASSLVAILYARYLDFVSSLGADALIVLAVGMSLRLLTVPLASAVIAFNQQGALFASSIAEAATNVVVSVVLGAQLGAIGVAIGTLAGAAVAVGLHGVALWRWLRDVQISRRWWIRTVPAPAVVFVLFGVVVLSEGA